MVSVRDAADAQAWLRDAEGVIAKESDAPYRPGERRGMVKVKRVRTIDAVVMGWRRARSPKRSAPSFSGSTTATSCAWSVTRGPAAAEKRRLVSALAPYETGERGSGEASRWTAGRDLQWVALRPELVVEIDFDHVSAGRIRHGAKLRRWREDKPARECTVAQLAQ